MAHFGQRYAAHPRQRVVKCPTCGADPYRPCTWDYPENPWFEKATPGDVSERITHGMTVGPHAARLRAEAIRREN